MAELQGQQEGQQQGQQQESGAGGGRWQRAADPGAVQQLLAVRPNSNPEVPELVALYAPQEGLLDVAGEGQAEDRRVVLLWDLNGTLTAHTSVSSPRPGGLLPGAALAQPPAAWGCSRAAACTRAQLQLRAGRQTPCRCARSMGRTH
jgi:hypothetical protein